MMTTTRADLEALNMDVKIDAELTTDDGRPVAMIHNPINEIVERKTHLMAMEILKALRDEPLGYDELRTRVVGASKSALFQMALNRLVTDGMVSHNVEGDEIVQVY